MKIFYVLYLSCAIIVNINAQDRFFTRSYTSNVLSKSSFDIEYWSTLRTSTNNSKAAYAHQRQLNNRLEFEFGLGNNLQTSFYFNSYNTYNLMQDTSLNKIQSNKISKTSFSNEWKYKLADPVAHPIGLALYLELGVASDEYEIESKIILDKRINKHLVALTLELELELEPEFELEDKRVEKELEIEKNLNFHFADMFFIKPNIGIGIEVSNHNKFDNKSMLEQSRLMAGPSFYLNSKRLFAIINMQTQVKYNFKSSAETVTATPDQLLDSRVIIGYSF